MPTQRKTTLRMAKPAQPDSTALPVQRRSRTVPTLPLCGPQSCIATSAVPTIAARKITTRRNLFQRGAGASVTATSRAGSVGNISRHSNSQDRAKTTATTAMRPGVGLTNQTAARASEPSRNV